MYVYIHTYIYVYVYARIYVYIYIYVNVYYFRALGPQSPPSPEEACMTAIAMQRAVPLLKLKLQVGPRLMGCFYKVGLLVSWRIVAAYGLFL